MSELKLRPPEKQGGGRGKDKGDYHRGTESAEKERETRGQGSRRQGDWENAKKGISNLKFQISEEG
jgi:hypothetical protein